MIAFSGALPGVGLSAFHVSASAHSGLCALLSLTLDPAVAALFKDNVFHLQTSTVHVHGHVHAHVYCPEHPWTLPITASKV